MLFLKQSTAATVKIGPFLDDSDGNTAETALTISQADVRLSKNGANIAQKTESSAATHDELGIYDCSLDTTDTGTLGRLQLWVHESGALQVWHEYMVVPANVYDSLVGGTDSLEVDATAISGDSTAADNAESFFDGTGYAGTNNVIPTVTTLTGHTAQTGDNYARLGAPAGASVSADIATIDGNVDSVLTDTGELQTNQGNWLTATDVDLNADQSAATVGTVTTVTNQVTANVTAISGDTPAADNLEADYDGTGYAKTASTIGTATDVTNQVTADATAISGDSTAADNLEAQYDGTGYTDDSAPATQSQVGNLTSGTAAINTTSESFTKAGAEPETNTYTATTQEDGVYHTVEDDGGATDCYYQFDVGGNGIPVSVTWIGYAQSNGDSYTIHAYNYGGTAYEQLGTISASNGTTPITETYSLTNAHVGTGANLGKVRFRFLSADGTAFATDRLLCSYAIVTKSVGYADGAIWIDTDASNTNTEAYVDGVADNPVSTWAAALTLNSTLGLDRFHIAGGSSITLTGDSTGYNLLGDGLFTLALGGQTITDAYIRFASVSGTGAGSAVIFEDCQFNNSVAIPPSYLVRCGILAASGTPLTANGAGEYALVDCVSLVAGSGTPYLDFSGTGGSSGVNIRRWAGGINVTLDSNNTLSHEVLAGGGCTITTGGADCEIRGTTRAVTVAMSAAETVQFVGVTGPISLSGTTTATVNLHGVSTSVTDTTSAATVTDNTVSQDNINAEVDTALSDYDGPTNAEMEARTLVAASYFDPAADTVATVTDVTNQVTADVTAISGDSTAADNLESDYDGTGYTKANSTIGTVTTNTDLVTAAAVADQVWEEAIADHSGTAGSTAEALDNATAPTAAAVADAVWDEAKAGHVGAGSFGEEVQAHSLSSEIAALNDLSAADVAGELATYDSPTKAEMDSGFAALNDLSTAQVNAEVDTALADYDAPTKAELDSGFAALNDVSTAEVNAQVDTALSDIHLDHLLAATYDPASKPGVADALLNELIENDGGVSRYTANALEEAPTGGSAPTVGEIADAVWDEAIAGHTAGGSFGEEVQAHALSSEVSGLNDLSAADVNAEVDTALTDYDPPTKAELDSGFAALNDPTVGAIADQVWEEALADHSGTAGSTAEALNAAGAAGDPWVTALPGAYGAGSAGNIVGNLNDPTAAVIADAVLDEALAGHVGAGSLGKAVADIETDATAILADTGELQTNQGDWATATGFSTHSAADAADAVWDEATAGHAGAGTAGKALTDTLADTNEMQGNQGDWATATDVDLNADQSAVTIGTVNTLTGHTAQTGDNFARLGAPAGASVSADVAAVKAETATIVTDTNELQVDWTNGGRLDLIVDAILAGVGSLQTDDIPGLIAALENVSAAEVNAEVVDVLRTDTLPDSYSADGAQPTIAQAVLEIRQWLMERAVAGTTVTVYKPNGSTTAMTFTLSDGTSPTSITRAT